MSQSYIFANFTQTKNQALETRKISLLDHQITENFYSPRKRLQYQVKGMVSQPHRNHPVSVAHTSNMVTAQSGNSVWNVELYVFMLASGFLPPRYAAPPAYPFSTVLRQYNAGTTTTSSLGEVCVQFVDGLVDGLARVFGRWVGDRVALP